MTQLYKLFYKEIPNQLFIKYKVIKITAYNDYWIAFIPKNQLSIPQLTLELVFNNVPLPLMIHNYHSNFRTNKSFYFLTTNEINKLNKLINK